MPPIPVIVNPFSRQGGGEDCLTALRAEGLDVTLLEVGDERPGALAEQALRAGARLVVVGGGDGTLAEAAGPIVAAGATLGVLPMGTGNTFARNLNLPLDLMGAAAVIARGQTRELDVGQVNGRIFLNSVTLGFSAHIAGALNGGLKKRLGWGAYPIAAFMAMRSARLRRYQLSVDGQAKQVRTRQLVAANAKDVAASLTVPGADYHDGKLVLMTIPGDLPYDALRVVWHWVRGDHSQLDYQDFSTLTIRAASGRRLTVNVDGDLLRDHRLKIEVQPQALKVMVGRDFQPT